MRTRTLGAGSLVGLAMASAVMAACSGDSRCNPANCLASLACHLQPAGMTDGTCFQSSGFVPYLRSSAGQAAILQYCADACNAVNGGADLQCIAQNFPGDSCTTLEQELILDGGSLNAVAEVVAARCGFSVGGLYDAGTSCGPNCVSCLDACSQARAQCDGTCLDAGSGESCLGCNFNCNQELRSCLGACPAN